jgi:exosortase
MCAAQELPEARTQRTSVWLPVCIGLMALYVPTCMSLYRFFWTTRDGSYGAVMLLLSLWLFWRARAVFRDVGPAASTAGGSLLILIGLLFYVVGRSQSFYQLEVCSAVPLLLGIGLVLLDGPGLLRLIFPILLLLFVIPVPGSIADELLLPLKELVSRIVDNLLHLAGYPIARNGVVLLIGPYSLLIADACSGLNSMVALSGIGLLYLYLAGHRTQTLNLALLASILPIALLANVLRVSALVLITFYFGDGAGASFHDAAGYLEILFAFGGFFALDSLLSRWLRGSDGPSADSRPGSVSSS